MLRRLAKNVIVSEVRGNRGRGKPKWRCVDGVNGLLMNKCICIDEERKLTHERITWRTAKHGNFRLGLQLIE